MGVWPRGEFVSSEELVKWLCRSCVLPCGTAGDRREQGRCTWETRISEKTSFQGLRRDPEFRTSPSSYCR